MQSVGMRSVGRFFRNAEKSSKKTPKKVLSIKKERTCQKMEFVYSNVEEKTMAESATEKKT